MTGTERAELEGKAQAFVRAMMLSVGVVSDEDLFAVFIAAATIADTLGATYGAPRHELARQVADDIRERVMSEVGPMGVS